MQKNKYEKFAEIFETFSMIEQMIESLLDDQCIEYNQEHFNDKANKFKKYLDGRKSKTVITNDKIFDNNTYSLDELLTKIQKYRNIAAHEAYYLLNGMSKWPKYNAEDGTPIRGKILMKRKYVGSFEHLYDDFMKYANLLRPIWEMWNEVDGNFEVFDINGRQIKEY
jgi:hypothetical protein